jgi:hypothetical protein
MQLKPISGCGVITAVTLTLASTAIAQPIPPKARDACIQRTAEEMVVATRDITVTSAGPIDPENGVRTLFMRNTRTGQTAQCRVNTIDGFVLSVSLDSSNPTPPPSGSTPTEGDFAGRGTASGAVFGAGQRADASLTFNQTGRFSLGIFVPPGTGADVRYLGIINQIRSTGTGNPNSFVLDGQVESFASSVNNRRVIETRGTCRIEVFDARIVSTVCSATTPGSNTRFTGMKQF